MLSRIIRCSFGIFLAVIAVASPANAIDTSFRYQINPQNNFGLCLDIVEASTANHALLQQFTCNGQANQRFDLTALAP